MCMHVHIYIHICVYVNYIDTHIYTWFIHAYTAI
jgi:hypothetical protein